MFFRYLESLARMADVAEALARIKQGCDELIVEDRLDWDFAIIDPPPRPSGQIQVKLNYIGRGKPIPVDFPDDEIAATGN